MRNNMNISFIYKATWALVTIFTIASTPLFAAENLFPDGDLESLTGFNNGNLGLDAGIVLANGATNDNDQVRAYGQTGTGWCRYINQERTQSNSAGSEAIPSTAGSGIDVGQNVTYCNHKRELDTMGIYRAIENVVPGGNYRISGDGATRGSFRWAVSYTRVGETEVTVVDLTETVVSDLVWVNIEDTFNIPYDVDTDKDVRVYLHTPPSATYPLSPDINLNERSMMWTDNYTLKQITSIEYFKDGDLESVTGFNAGGNLGLDAGIVLANGATNDNGQVRAYGQTGTGWCRYINQARTASNSAGSEQIPSTAGSGIDVGQNVTFCNHKRELDTMGIYRAIESVQPGKSYQVSGDGATRGSFRWAVEYTKVGETDKTVLDLNNTVVSDLAWVSISDVFIAPNDIDVEKDVRVYLHTPPSATYPLTPGINLNERSMMWTDNYSLMGPPGGKDTDEDGIFDIEDAFVDDPTASTDTDGDGMPDDFNEPSDICDQACIDASSLILDDDDDNDGFLDVNDGYPLDNTQSIKIELDAVSAIVISNREHTVDASASIPNSDNATYSWLQTSGPTADFTGTGQTMTLTAPLVDVEVDAVFELTVTNSATSATATFTANLVPPPSEVTVNATISTTELTGGIVVTLDASASVDSHGKDLIYTWEQVSGYGVSLTDDDTAIASFTVPVIYTSSDVVFIVTVTNGEAYDVSTGTFEIAATITREPAINADGSKSRGGSFGSLGILLLACSALFRRKFIK